MNILTQDIISVIASRNYSTITLKYITSRLMIILYLDENGTRHRINGPAIIWNDNEWHWRFRGRLHRSYKPALMSISGYEWYNMGKLMAYREK